jgi:hypothetical protein
MAVILSIPAGIDNGSSHTVGYGSEVEMSTPADITSLESAFALNAHDARALVDGCDETTGTWRPAPGSWSIAECLDHLATSNRVYLAAMRPSAERARERGRLRRGPAVPGLLGGWFVRSLEPPARRGLRTRAPRTIQPRSSPALADAAQQFFASHHEVERFLAGFADLDLAGVGFPNPFLRGVRFSLATGIHVLAAHERRHLWQARNVESAFRRTGPAEAGL